MDTQKSSIKDIEEGTKRNTTSAAAEYRKCPTVEDLTCGLEQTKAQFRPDEVDGGTSILNRRK